MKVDGRLRAEGLLPIDPSQILLEISVTKTVVFLTPQNHAPNRHVLGWFVFTNTFTNQFATTFGLLTQRKSGNWTSGDLPFTTDS